MNYVALELSELNKHLCDLKEWLHIPDVAEYQHIDEDMPLDKISQILVKEVHMMRHLCLNYITPEVRNKIIYYQILPIYKYNKYFTNQDFGKHHIRVDIEEEDSDTPTMSLDIGQEYEDFVLSITKRDEPKKVKILKEDTVIDKTIDWVNNEASIEELSEFCKEHASDEWYKRCVEKYTDNIIALKLFSKQIIIAYKYKDTHS